MYANVFNPAPAIYTINKQIHHCIVENVRQLVCGLVGWSVAHSFSIRAIAPIVVLVVSHSMLLSEHLESVMIS